ncbi:hypothetical protein SLEP1_g39566 [Rubroshorea leprosula]|uniref:Uncharacterized protein n=1 Tax=Rubroshorea leprosula TaxID=152421 RepID=A0AAV5L0M8_9ROSI|nr:hypothetical protein SLEP1_g39566 [Rubroshorea leprosula]
MISSKPCAFVGPVSRVHDVCRIPGFGFWGMTELLWKSHPMIQGL